MTELDPRSIAITVSLSGLLLMMVIGTAGGSRVNAASARSWLYACLCSIAGLAHNALAPGEQFTLTIVIGNTLIHAAVALLWHGAQKHRGRPASLNWIWVTVVFTALWGWYFGLVNRNDIARVVAFSLLICAWCVAGAWSFAHIEGYGTRLARWMTVLPLGLFAALLLFRAGHALAVGAPGAPNSRTTVNALTYLGGSLVLMSLMVGIILLLNARLSSEVRRMAFEDMLTGTASRRGLYAALPAWLQRHAGKSAPAHVALIDLDDFKTVNDLLGHSVGDSVLKDFAEVSRAHLPEGAFTARFGGDEFAVLLPPSVDEKALLTWAATLRAAFETAAATRLAGISRGRSVNPSLSIGWAQINSATVDHFDEALRKADAQLYEQKAGNRPALRYVRSGPGALTS